MNTLAKPLAAALVILSVCISLSAGDLNIGIVWVGKSGMAKRVNKGLKTQLKKSAPSMKLEEKAELATIDELAKVIKDWSKSKDGIVLLRSNGAAWLASHPPEKPTFIGGCNNPIDLGTVKNLEKPGGKITGVTYYMPATTSFEIFKAILPKLENVLLLTEKGHKSSPIDIAETEKACKKYGIKLKSASCATKEDVLKSVKGYKEKNSAIIIGNQSLIIDNTKAIVAAAGKEPVFAYSSQPVKDGALGGCVADDGRLGAMLAESVVDVLVDKKPIGDVPIKVDPKPNFYVNVKTAEGIGIEIPFEILDSATLIK